MYHISSKTKPTAVDVGMRMIVSHISHQIMSINQFYIDISSYKALKKAYVNFRRIWAKKRAPYNWNDLAWNIGKFNNLITVIGLYGSGFGNYFWVC